MATDLDTIEQADLLEGLLQRSAASGLSLDPLRLYAAQHAVRLEEEAQAARARSEAPPADGRVSAVLRWLPLDDEMALRRAVGRGQPAVAGRVMYGVAWNGDAR